MRARKRVGKPKVQWICEWIRLLWLLRKYRILAACTTATVSKQILKKNNGKFRHKKLGIKCTIRREVKWILHQTHTHMHATWLSSAVSNICRKTRTTVKPLLSFIPCVKMRSFYSVTFFQLLFFDCTNTNKNTKNICILCPVTYASPGVLIFIWLLFPSICSILCIMHLTWNSCLEFLIKCIHEMNQNSIANFDHTSSWNRLNTID